MAKLLTPELPSWMAILKPDSLLNSRDVAQIFGYKSAKTLVCAVHNKLFPVADHQMPTQYGKHSFQWRKSTIIAEIERRKSLQVAQ